MRYFTVVSSPTVPISEDPIELVLMAARYTRRRGGLVHEDTAQATLPVASSVRLLNVNGFIRNE